MSKRHASIFIGLTLSVATALTGTAGIFSQPASAASYVTNNRVVGYYPTSADTLYITIDGKITKVRMIGLDAPKATSRENTKKGCYATQAKNVLKQITRGQFVRLVSDPKMPDKYTDGSLLRYVYVGNYDVGATMIYNGAAKEYMYQHKNYSQRAWYKNLQTQAYNNWWGMWGSGCSMNR